MDTRGTTNEEVAGWLCDRGVQREGPPALALRQRGAQLAASRLHGLDAQAAGRSTAEIGRHQIHVQYARSGFAPGRR